MKKYLLFFVSLAGSIYVNAQKIDIGVRGGLSIPNLSGGGSNATPLSQGYSSRLSAGFAAFAEFKINKTFSIQPMLEYSSQGGKKDKLQALSIPSDMVPLLQAGLPAGTPMPQYLYANFKSEAKFNYLMLPILAKFGWDLGASSPFRLYADAGPFIGVLLNAKQVTSGNSELYLDDKGQMPIRIDPTQPFPQNLNAETDIKDQLHKVNAGAEANIGIAYKINRGSVFIEGGGNYGFVKIQKADNIGKNNIGAGTVMIGFKYSL